MIKTLNKLVLICLLLTSIAHAQAVTSFMLYPTEYISDKSNLIYHEVKPGDQIQDSFIVVNPAEITAKAFLYVVDENDNPESNKKYKNKGDESIFVGSWIELSENEVFVNSDGNAIVNFTLSVPQDVEYGSYEGAIYAERITGESSAVNAALKDALPVELLVTDNPTIYERETHVKNNDWLPNVIYWGSLIVFVGATILFIKGLLKKKKNNE